MLLFFKLGWFLTFFILLIFFLFYEFRETNYCSLGGLFICDSTPLVCEGLLFFFSYFGMVSAFGSVACCFFPQCVQAVIPLSGVVLL